MKMKWGALVVDGRGKIGGQVASKNRSGAYLRTKVTPVNPQTAAQNLVRNRLGTLSQAWRGLTQAQRDAWNAAVSSFSSTNIFGDPVNPTGFNLFQQLNNNLILAGNSALDTPPSPAAIDDIVIGVLTAEDTPTLSLAYTVGSGGSKILVFATPPVSAGVSFVKSEYRLVTSFDSDTASPLDMAAAYATKFGAITGAEDQKIFVKTVSINTDTGQAGIPQSTYAIVISP